MITVNVSRVTGWVRAWLSIACLAALAWAVYVFFTNHDAVYWNVGSSDHFYYYVLIGIYVVVALAALVGLISGVAGVRSPGDAPGWLLNVVLLVLLALTLWSGTLILGSRVFLD